VAVVATWGHRAQAGKHVFFEKEAKKRLIRLTAAFLAIASPDWQKFFGSFFQKRTPSFLHP